MSKPEDLTKEEKVALIKAAFPDYPGDQPDYSLCDRCPTFASCDESIHDPPFPCHELKAELCSLIEKFFEWQMEIDTWPKSIFLMLEEDGHGGVADLLQRIRELGHEVEEKEGK